MKKNSFIHSTIHSFIHSFIHSTIHLFFLSFFLSSVLLLSCSDKKVDHQKFIDAYIDLRITEDTMKTGTKSIQDLKNDILKKHGLTEEQYDKTINYFNENPELWNDFYDQIIARVDTLRKGGK